MCSSTADVMFNSVRVEEGVIVLNPPLDLTLSTSIKSLKAKDVKKALRDQLDLLKQKNITAVKVHSDGGFNTITPSSTLTELNMTSAVLEHMWELLKTKSKQSRIELVPF
jgi:hypothetical protein